MDVSDSGSGVVCVRRSSFFLVQRVMALAVLLFLFFYIVTVFFDYEMETVNVVPLVDVLSYEGFFALLFSLVYVFFVFVVFLGWRSTCYEISRRFITERRGVLSKSERGVSVESIDSITLKQSMPGKLLDYGTLHILNNKGETIFILDSIENPHKHKNQIIKNMEDQTEKQQNKKNPLQ
jgi:uncharacterized membrane protein YdbT with pleckstrin-like domain